tara:strand:+ start:1947 stop:3062 length:1116 start_codon:yes stop_codon:yes gene_type:complete
MPFSARQGFFKTVASASAVYPDWPDQANVSQFNTEVAQYSGAAGSVVNVASSSGSNAYRGAVRAPNGNIYFIGRNQNNLKEYDPSTHVNTAITLSGLGSNNYTGGCLGRNGNIYLAPFSASSVLEFDPVNRTSRQISVSISGDNKYNGAVVDTTGNVFCIPQNESKFIKVDCSTEPVTVSTPTFGASFTDAGVISGTVHPNGNIYCAPLQDDGFLEVDPAAGTSSRYSTGKGTGQLLCQGALTGADGNIYGISYNSSTILRLNPTTKAVDEPFSHGQGTNAFIGGTAAPNGNLYLAPFDANNVFEIDPLAGTTNTIAISPSEDEFVGATSDTANVYLCPNNSSHVKGFPTNASGGTNANAYTLSSFVNSGH